MNLYQEVSDAFPVQLEIVVQWGDMDAARHVNNTTYLRWFETARIEYLTKLGLDVINSDHSADFILGWQDCKYIFPVTFPDTVLVGIKVNEIKTDRLVMQANMYSLKHGRLAAIAKGDMVTYDYAQLKKVPVPEALADKVRKIELPNT